MMVMMRASVGRVLIRMTPLAVTGKLRMRVTTVWKSLIDNVTRRVRLDHLGFGGSPSRATEPSLVFAFLFAWVAILSIV